jgi:hypothetical protein
MPYPEPYFDFFSSPQWPKRVLKDKLPGFGAGVYLHRVNWNHQEAKDVQKKKSAILPTARSKGILKRTFAVVRQEND